MRNNFFLGATVLAVAAGMVGGSLALAADDAVTNETTDQRPRFEEREKNREQRTEDRQQMRQDRERNRQENRQDRETLREEKREGVVQLQADQVGKRFAFHIGRFERIIAKIESRFAQMKTDGKNMAAAEAKLGEAKSALDAAKALADQTVAAYKAIDAIDATARKTQFDAAKALATQTREKFQSANVLLKEAVALAKQAK